MTEYPTLDSYLNGFLYPAFADDYGNEEGALAAYARMNPDAPAMINAEISQLRTRGATEDDLDALFVHKFGAMYDVHLAGERWWNWLDRISAEAARLAGSSGGQTGKGKV